MNFIVRFIGSLIKYLIYISVIIIAAGVALFWFDTGSWLVHPLAERAGSFFLSPMKLKIQNVNGSLRNGYSLDGLRLFSGDKDLLTLNHFSVSPDWDLVLAGMDGLPFIKSLNVNGVSTDLDSVMMIASVFPPSSEDKPKPVAEPFDIHLNPANISVKDIFFGSPYANLKLDALTLNEAGKFLLDAKLSSRDNVLPLRANASLNLSRLEVMNSDIRIGSKGTGKIAGRLQPVDAKLFLTAIQLDDFTRLISPDMKASGRIDAKITAKDNDGAISASGVVSMPRAEVMNIPLNFRLPFTWNGKNIFTLDDASLSTKAAGISLSLSGDIERMRFSAKGEGKNISLTEIGSLFAPDVKLIGENGHVKFDVSTEYTEDVMKMLLQHTRASLAANIPSITAMGIKTAENLTANVKLIPNQPPKIAMGGKAFGGKIFARGQAMKDSEGNILPHSVIISIVGLDLPSVIGTFPEIAKQIGKTSGKITATVKISEALNVTGKITSDRLSAYGVTLSGLNADVNYDVANSTAELQDFSANMGKGRITANAAANLAEGTFTANADANNITLGTIPMLRGVSGAYSLKAKSSGNFNDINTITADALLTARNAGYEKITKGNIDVPVTFSRGVVRVSDASIRFPGISAKVRAEANINTGTFSANADADNLDLRFIPQLKDLKGKYSLIADASGNFYNTKTITGSALLTAQNAGYSSYKIGNAEIPATFRNNVLTVSNAHAELPKGSASLNAEVNLNNSTLKANADVQNLELGFIPDLKDVKGRYSLKADASGKFTDINAITVNASLSAQNAGFQEMRFGNADIPVSFKNGVLTINGAKASLPGGNLSAKGTVNIKNMNNPLLDVTASTGGINIAQLLDGLNINDVPATGNVKGSVSVKGRADNPRVSAAVNATNIDIKAAEMVKIPSANIVADGDMKRINIVKLNAKVNGSEINGTGKILPDMNNVMATGVDVETTIKHLDLKALLKNFMQKAPVEGVIDAIAGVTGTIDQPTAYLKLTRPVLYQKSEIHDIAVSVRSPEPNHFLINGKARVDNFKPESDIDVQIKDDGIYYTVNTKPLDIESAIESQMPEMAGIAKGFATVSVKGSTKPHDNISINARSRAITVMDKIKIANINIPVKYITDSGRVQMRKARAELSGGIIESQFDLDTATNEWAGHAEISHLDFGKLAQPFMPEGELVGTVDGHVDMNGSSPMGMSLNFAEGRFKTGPGCIQKVEALKHITPTEKITFEEISGSFFWNGRDLFLNPGTGARAGIDEPLYRYFTVNGSAGIPGKGMRLLFDGRFDMKILDRLLGAMKGVFQYMTGSLARNVLRDAASRVMGFQGRDYQNVSFTLTNASGKIALQDLKVTKPIEDFLPIDILNNDQEKQKETTQFKMSFKLPVGEGAPSAEEESTTDQFKRQLIDNLFNIGM